MTRSTSQAVTEVLQAATEPLTIAEIMQRIEPMQVLRTAKPKATVRSALFENARVATLGGRPARYVWWPKHLQGCCFRQPLAQMNFTTGELPVTTEVWSALWPDFLASKLKPVAITIELNNGPTLTTKVEHLRAGKPIWGLVGEPKLAEWCRSLAAGPDDDLILRVLDVQRRRYGLSLERAATLDATERRERDEYLMEEALEVVRASHEEVALHHHLIPRLVARDLYRYSVPPSPLGRVLRADLRFVISDDTGATFTARLVERAEAERHPYDNSLTDGRPKGHWLTPESDEERRAWGEYLFDQGMEYRWAEQDRMAEAYYRAALMVDPGHADAWVHVGNTRLDEGLLDEALENYLTAEAAALERTIGDPATYEGPFWLDLDSRPYMRALHGKGLALWRLGRRDEAAAAFRQQLELNPNDNQGVRFMLPDLEAGLSWEESTARFEESEQSRSDDAAFSS